MNRVVIVSIKSIVVEAEVLSIDEEEVKVGKKEDLLNLKGDRDKDNRYKEVLWEESTDKREELRKMIVEGDNTKTEKWMKERINIIVEIQKYRRGSNNKWRKSTDMRDSSKEDLKEEKSKKIKEKEMIEEIKGILSTEEIVNKRNTKNMKRDMIQGHINLKMDQNIGWMKQLATIKRTIREDNKEIEDNNVVKKE